LEQPAGTNKEPCPDNQFKIKIIFSKNCIWCGLLTDCILLSTCDAFTLKVEMHLFALYSAVFSVAPSTSLFLSSLLLFLVCSMLTVLSFVCLFLWVTSTSMYTDQHITGYYYNWRGAWGFSCRSLWSICELCL